MAPPQTVHSGLQKYDLKSRIFQAIYQERDNKVGFGSSNIVKDRKRQAIGRRAQDWGVIILSFRVQSG